MIEMVIETGTETGMGDVVVVDGIEMNLVIGMIPMVIEIVVEIRGVRVEIGIWIVVDNLTMPVAVVARVVAQVAAVVVAMVVEGLTMVQLARNRGLLLSPLTSNCTYQSILLITHIFTTTPHPS